MACEKTLPWVPTYDEVVATALALEAEGHYKVTADMVLDKLDPSHLATYRMYAVAGENVLDLVYPHVINTFIEAGSVGALQVVVEGDFAWSVS
jgi:hypothetical protein